MIVISGVCYWAHRAPKNPCPDTFHAPPHSTAWVRVVFFVILCLCPGSGPRPTHTPYGYRLEMGGTKLGPVQAMSVGGPRTGAVLGLQENTPPSSLSGQGLAPQNPLGPVL